MLIREKYTTLNNQEQNAGAVKELLQSPLNKYHLTLSPVHNLNIYVVLKSFKTFIHQLNQLLYGKRYKNKNQHINGIVILESAESYNPHFHMIIRDPNNNLEDKFQLETAVAIVLQKLVCWVYEHYNSEERGKKTPKLFVDPKCWLLQDYYNDIGDDLLEIYLSKESNKEGYWHNSSFDNIGILYADGVDFGYRENVKKNFNYRSYSAQ